MAYVGEVIRNATGGNWAIEANRDEDWQPVILGPDGARYSTFVIFKELLERGSMFAVIHYDTGKSPTRTPRPRAGLFASRPLPITPPIGTLALVPEDAYEVTKRYGDGRPWGVRFTRDVEADGFPFAAGTEGWFARRGDIITGVLSRPWASGQLQLPAGTAVQLYAGHRDGRVYSAKLGADQQVHGLPCKSGTTVFFRVYKHIPYIESATLAVDYEINGVLYRAGSWIALDRKGRLTDSRPPS